MGPQAAKSYPGPKPIHTEPRQETEGDGQPAGRARQEVGYGRRGQGYIFGAFRPTTGAALTRPYPSRSTANWANFLGHVEAWVPPEVDRV